MQRVRKLGFAYISMVIFFCDCFLANALRPSDPEGLYRMCKNSVDNDDPRCMNGGYLRAQNTTEQTNCAVCECPAGWGGVDCSVCTIVDVCPARTLPGGRQQQPAGCTSDSMMPTEYELGSGKTFSCMCGGLPGDASTEWACKQQPLTYWVFTMLPQNDTNTSIAADNPWGVAQHPSASHSSSDPFSRFLTSARTAANKDTKVDFHVVERGGIMSIDLNPHDFQYAYAGVWEGNFTGCTFSTGACTRPLEGDDCFVATCEGAGVVCPPPFVKKCPGWTPTSCGRIHKDQPGDYWMHRCNPLATPKNDTATILSCKPQAVNGTFQCYFGQEGAFLASLGMQCQTGSCVYNSSQPDPPGPPAPPLPPPLPPHEHHDVAAEVITLIGIGMVVSLGMLLGGFLIYQDSRLSQQRYRAWSEGETKEPTVTSSLLTGDEQAGDVVVDSLPERVALDWHNISCSIYKAGGQRLQVLTDVSGITSAAHTTDGDADSKGCLFSILGPSGAGKTTLLDILAGRRRGLGVSGQLLLNGHPVDGQTTRDTVGYAQQDPELPGTSTVWEFLRFHARLRMPEEQKRNDTAEARVWGVISQLGLNKVAHSLIGDAFTRGVSGGERRRVAIAAELLTSPACLLLDEPTTGLDSSNASRVVDILSALASAGVTVIITIHQPRPDILRLMDRMLLLSGNGQVVYSGPLDEAASYFKELGFVPDELRSNIADYMLDLVIRADDADVAAMIHRFAGSDIAAKDEAALEGLCQEPWPLSPPRPHPPFALQLRVLSTRLMRKLYRHPFLILVNFIATLVTAVALGLIFRNAGVDTGGIQNRLGCLFFMLLYLSMMSLSSLPIWRAEKLLFIRERDAGAYGTRAYYAAVLLFDIVPMRVVPPLFFAMFSYWMIGLHTQCTSCIFAFIGVLVSANIAATTVSQAIGAAVASVRVANLLGSLAIMMFLLFGGFLLNRDQVPWYCTWIADLSYFNYAYEALAVNEFHHAPVDFIFTSPLNDSVLPPLRVSGDGVLREFGFVPGRGWLDTAMVWVLGACFGLLTYCFLETAGRTGQQSLWGFSMAWVTSMKKRRRSSSGLASDSPLAGVNQELAEPSNGHVSSPASPSAASRRTHPTLQKLASRKRGANGLIISNSADLSDTRGVPEASVSVDGFLQVAPQIVTWEGISCKVTQGHSGRQRQILHSISGVAAVRGEDGELVPCLFAVLGPSGAGKTTFMDILSGRKRDSGVSGRVSVNGIPLTAATMQRVCGYVLQDDVLPGTSTVQEYLRFQADLRLPPSVHAAARQAQVQHLIQQLGLQKVANSLIGDEFTRGLSGGERRRVAIAAELLTSPSCLLLDEPTTGLDSSNAARVVDILAGLASAGVTVIITIHQPRPDVFNLMQRVLILSGNGRLVYSGPKDMAAQHFATAGYFAPGRDIGMADHMLDVVIRSEGAEVAELVDLYRDSQVAAADRALTHDLASAGSSDQRRCSLQLRYQASYWRQLATLSRRLAKATWVDPMLLAMNWGAALLMALGLGIVYWHATRDTGGIQNRFGSLFFILIYMSVMSLSSLPLWMEDRLLFIRERASGVYGTPAYFTATVLFDLIPMRVLPPCFFAAATYWMVGFRPGLWHLLTFLLLLVLSNMVGASMNMAIGAAAPSTAVANLLGSLAVLLSILFGGFLLSSKQMPNVVSWMAQLSFVRYGFEALVYNEYHGATGFFFTPYAQKRIPGAKLPSVEVDGDTILGTFGFETEDIGNNVAVLLLLLLAYLTTTLLLLVFKRN